MVCLSRVFCVASRQPFVQNAYPKMCVSCEGQGACGGYFSYTCSPLPDPVDVWISLMSDAVPFIQNVFVVCPSTMMGKRDMERLRSQCRRIFPTAQVGCTTRGKRRNSGKFSASPYLLTSPELSSSSWTAQQTWVTPLDALPPKSQDIVVFACNVFGREMLWDDAPSHITAAHRVLKPHGILAILGYPLDVRVSAPSFASEDANDFLSTMAADLDRVLDGFSSLNDKKLKKGIGDKAKGHLKPNESSGNRKERRQEEARRAKFVLESLSTGHQDMYFPFPAISRRWFECEYALSPTELAACYRSLPSYSPCYSPFVVEEELHDHYAHLRNLEEKSDMMNGEDDFVALPPLNGLDNKRSSLFPSCRNTFSSSTSRMIRRPTVGLCVSPVSMLLDHWHVNHGLSPLISGSIRVRALHFLLTCSYRGVNVLEAPSFSSAISSHAKELLRSNSNNM